MALPKLTQGDRDKKVKDLISFAESLPSQIGARGINQAILPEIRNHIKQLLLQTPVSAGYAADLDARGTELWNFATRIRRDGNAAQRRSSSSSKPKEDNDAANVAKVACLVRVCAFLLLDSAWQASSRTERRAHNRNLDREFRSTVRLTKVAVKAGKSCLEQDEVEMCHKVMEKAASFAHELESKTPGNEDDGRMSRRLRAEYSVMRTALAWKQGRLDIAEHMYSKADLAEANLDAVSSEELADILFEIGKALVCQGKFEPAVVWLDRALTVLEIPELEDLSIDAGELRLSIMQSLVRSHLGLGTEESRQNAVDLVKLLETDYADKTIVLLLKLEIIVSAKEIDASRYYETISRMIRSIILTTKNIKTLLFHIHKLKGLDCDLAGKALEELLELRLLVESEGREEWIEKALITRILIAVSTDSQQATPESFRDVLDQLYQAFRQPASQTATHAAQTLLWKQAESAFKKGRHGVAEAWCRLALHKMFENCGEINRSKIARKMIQCALLRHDLTAAREAFFLMADAGRAAPLSRYLLYKVALRDRDKDLATESLDLICKSSEKDATLLFACILEAQNFGDKEQTIAALQTVLGKYDYEAPDGVHFPALLRCMVRLLLTDAPQDVVPSEQVMQELCKVFNSAADQAARRGGKGKSKSTNVFDAREVEWFSRESYNIAIKCSAKVDPTYTVHLTHSCSRLVDVLLAERPAEEHVDLRLRQIFCEWLGACAHVVVARTEDNIESSHQHYLAVRKCGEKLRQLLPAVLDHNVLSTAAREDLIDKHFQIVKFELEAALRLCQWEQMDDLFSECWKYDDPKHWDTLADLVLVIHSSMVEAKLEPSRLQKILAALQNIINRAHRTKGSDTALLARWLRCLFQIAVGFDETTGLRCVEQAHAVAQSRRGSSKPYPQEELEWLATTVFNRAVDHYCISDDVKAKQWGEKALVLAATVDDQGALLTLLQEKYSGLTWQN